PAGVTRRQRKKSTRPGRDAGPFLWCAEHDRQLGGESLLSSLMVAKLFIALPQPAYEGSQHVGIVIGPDALSGIGRQDRPKLRLGECPELLVLARHRGDDRDPLLLARIFLNVAAVIEARNRAVCIGDAGNDAS